MMLHELESFTISLTVNVPFLSVGLFLCRLFSFLFFNNLKFKQINAQDVMGAV